ncbi:MAG: ABC transporter ATP-binding protein [Spirochaetota bacterium]
MSSTALRVSNLEVTFGTTIRAVRGLSLEVRRGSIHALVGESGSGKSVTAKAMLGLLPETAAVAQDRLEIDGIEIPSRDRSAFARLRGKRVSMVFQEPGKHLNPAFTVRVLLTEALTHHLGLARDEAVKRSRELLEQVDLDPAEVLGAYPHELSGGMKQRVLIALAVSCNPALLIADEPTTALDVTVQAQIIALLDRLRRELDMAVLFISHDLGLVQSIADDISVMYAGRIVDSSEADELLTRPLHPYTELLLESIPRPDLRGRPLSAIPGRVPDAAAIPAGCAFHPRCPLAEDLCTREDPALAENAPGHVSACHFANALLEGRV